MLRRWIIRSLFLVPLVCVVGVWVASYFGGISYRIYCRGYAWVAVGVEGHGALAIWPNRGFPGFLTRYEFVRNATSKEWIGVPTLFGFYAGKPSRDLGDFALVFPLWLPTLLLLGLNGFVWRKTRRRAGGGAFPVEPNAVAK